MISRALYYLPLVFLSFLPACAQPPKPVTTFDDCLITHMAAIVMLDDASFEEDVLLRNNVIASQTQLLSDDTLDEDELAQRTSTLLSSYGRAAEAATAMASANGTAPGTLAADAMSCREALVQ